MSIEINGGKRIRWVAFIFLGITVLIIARLFSLQVLQHNYYVTFAASAREISQKITPHRGQVYFSDARSGEEFPAIINRTYYQVYAVPKDIAAEVRNDVIEKLSTLLSFNDEAKNKLAAKLAKENDPYESVARKVTEEVKNQIEAAKLPGIHLLGEQFRFYPEHELGAQVLGFYGVDNDGNPSGRYGLEGYWDQALAGKSGLLNGLKGVGGGWGALSGRTVVDAEDGADFVLTIDRALELNTCKLLQEGMEKYEAKSASAVILNPNTGAVLAMCSFPAFDPNDYAHTETVNAYNNDSIFTPYEPGSVFKAITVATALDLGLISPDTTFVDPCERKIDKFTIRNAEQKCYGKQTMTQALEFSINTAMIWLVEQIGNARFYDYVERFGFGTKTGITLETESSGNISALQKKSLIYSAVGSFGQGITATPLQVATAYATIANGGNLLKPFVIAETRYPNGRRVVAEPETVRSVISARTAKLLTGMLVAVVEHGHSMSARLPNYYIAGKTGTAQIPGPGGYYTEDTNHTFAGFAPAHDPKVVVVVHYERPARQWADSTTAPTFREIMRFALEYYAVPHDK